MSLPPAKREFLPCPHRLQLLDNSRYEQACDQAIAMCDGNLRSTIKALIMANEYLEAELEELQAAVRGRLRADASVFKRGHRR